MNLERPVKLAQSILSRYWDKKIPISSFDIASKISDLKIIYEEFEDDKKGECYYDFKQNSYIIKINKNHHDNLKRFWLAELLWVYANLNNYSNGKFEYFRNYKDSEIKKFAYELLMPKGVIMNMITEMNIIKVEELAYRLWVSEEQMLEKLRYDGIVKN